MADTQRGRLINLIRESVKGCSMYWSRCIADYLLANGVIVPPCKVGDMVYVIDKFGDIVELKAEYLVFDESQIYVGMGDYGECKTNEVYLHRWDAEKALNERSEYNG